MLSWHAPSPDSLCSLQAKICDLVFDACQSSSFFFYFPIPLLSLHNQTDFNTLLKALSASTWASGSACCQAMAHTAVACSSIDIAGEQAGGFMYSVTFKVQGTWFQFMHFSRVISLLCPFNVASSFYLFVILCRGLGYVKSSSQLDELAHKEMGNCQVFLN